MYLFRTLLPERRMKWEKQHWDEIKREKLLVSRSEVSAQREIRGERGRVKFGESLKLLVIIIIINIWHSEASPYLSLSPLFPIFLSHVAFNIFYLSRSLPAHPSWFLTYCLFYHLCLSSFPLDFLTLVPSILLFLHTSSPPSDSVSACYL